MTANPRLSDILSRSEHVMFDFDGPVCSVFAGHPAPYVAEGLRKIVQESMSLTEELRATKDPLVFFQAAPSMTSSLAERVRRQLHAEELEAVESACPTPGAHEAIIKCWHVGKIVTIVSNNAADAVNAYLNQHGLSSYVSYVSARQSSNPALMKPSPYLLLAALAVTGQLPERSVLIGDSVTDIEAAHAAHTAAIGYANKNGKRERFEAAGANAIVTSLYEVLQSVAQPGSTSHA